MPRLARVRGLADLAVALWAAAWIAMGVVVAHDVRGMTQLSRTLVDVGVATRNVGTAVGAIGGVPLVGDRIGNIGDSVTRAGNSAVRSGRTSGGSVRRLSTLLGVAIALIPVVPVLAVYVPGRWTWTRERRALARIQQHAGDDPLLEPWLARRALERLPYRELVAISARPWEPADHETAAALADAELRRLGLSPRRASGGPDRSP